MPEIAALESVEVGGRAGGKMYQWGDERETTVPLGESQAVESILRSRRSRTHWRRRSGT